MRIFKIIKGILGEIDSVRLLLTSILEETAELNKAIKELRAESKILNQSISEIGTSIVNSGNSLSRFLQDQKTVKEIEVARIEEILEEQGQKPTLDDLIF